MPTTELYVSPTGNDANTGAARTSALKTTAAAIARLGPGVRLNFTAGTYGCAGAFIANFNGGTTAPGSIRSVDGPRAAKFDCTTAGGTPGGSFLLDFVRGFIFEGIEVSNTAGHGIQVMSGGGPTWDIDTVSSDIVLHNSYIHHTGLAGMKASQARRITAIGNELAHIPLARQTLEFVAVDEVVLAGNEAHHSGYFNEIKGGAHGPHVIFANYIHDSDGGILVAGPGTGYQFLVHTDADFEAKDLKVWNNVIVNVPREAFYVWACHDCVVAHNTYYGAAPNASFRILPSDFTNASGNLVRTNHNRNVTVVNNLFLSGSRFNDMVIGLASEDHRLGDEPQPLVRARHGDDRRRLFRPAVRGRASVVLRQQPDAVGRADEHAPADGKPGDRQGARVAVRDEQLRWRRLERRAEHRRLLSRTWRGCRAPGAFVPRSRLSRRSRRRARAATAERSTPGRVPSSR